MKQNKDAAILHFGQEQLQLIGLGRLHRMRSSWDEKRHSNAQWELHLILKGSCRVDLEEGRCRLQGGEALLIPPGQYHCPKADAGAFERFSLSFLPKPGVLARQLQERCSGSIHLLPTDHMLQLAAGILREDMTQQVFRQTAMEAMLTYFLVELFRLLGLSENSAAGADSTGSRITETVDTYFERHFADAGGEQALADLLHISRRQLVRLLQQHYGMNFRQKLINTRMDHAAWLLRTTQLPVSGVCEKVGYSSEAAFFKIFRNQFGTTPHKYRTEKRMTDR